MEHREASHCGEPVRVEPTGGGVSFHYLDIRSVEALPERPSERRVDFHSGEMGDSGAEEISRESWSGTDLEYIVTEVTSRIEPGQQVLSEHLRPLWTRQEVDVGLIHDCSFTPTCHLISSGVTLPAVWDGL